RSRVPIFAPSGDAMILRSGRNETAWSGDRSPDHVGGLLRLSAAMIVGYSTQLRIGTMRFNKGQNGSSSAIQHLSTISGSPSRRPAISVTSVRRPYPRRAGVAGSLYPVVSPDP